MTNMEIALAEAEAKKAEEAAKGNGKAEKVDTSKPKVIETFQPPVVEHGDPVVKTEPVKKSWYKTKTFLITAGTVVVAAAAAAGYFMLTSTSE